MANQKKKGLIGKVAKVGVKGIGLFTKLPLIGKILVPIVGVGAVAIIIKKLSKAASGLKVLFKTPIFKFGLPVILLILVILLIIKKKKQKDEGQNPYMNGQGPNQPQYPPYPPGYGDFRWK